MTRRRPIDLFIILRVNFSGFLIEMEEINQINLCQKDRCSLLAYKGV